MIFSSTKVVESTARLRRMLVLFDVIVYRVVYRYVGCKLSGNFQKY